MTAAYCRKKDTPPVCTTQEAREYFREKGLTYHDITEGDILALVLYLNQEIKKAIKDREMSTTTMHLSQKVDMKKRSNGTITECYLYMNSHYFTRLECISFNQNGYIGFAGWADQGNTNPILRAFLRWCDSLTKVEESDQ